MKIYSPFVSPKQIIETNRIMRDVKEGTKRLRVVKERRYQAFLQHSKMGYFPNGRKDKLSKRIKNFFIQLKDTILFNDLY